VRLQVDDRIARADPERAQHPRPAQEAAADLSDAEGGASHVLQRRRACRTPREQVGQYLVVSERDVPTPPRKPRAGTRGAQ
jgi:hypothetical protein